MSGPARGEGTTRSRARGRVWLPIAVFASLGCLGLLWALASPLNGTPDEDAHIIKAAGVALGQGDGIEVQRPDGSADRVFIVPASAGEVEDLGCHQFVPGMPAAACSTVNDQPPAGEGMVFAQTPAASYNPVFYAITGWPIALWQDHSGIYLARAVNALLIAGFFAAAAWSLSLLPRPQLPLGGLLAIATPSIMQYAGAVNPQGLEVAALTAFTAALLTALRIRPRGAALWGLAAVLAIAGGLGAQARGLSWVWLGCIVLACAAWAGPARFLRLLRTPAGLGAALLSGAGCAFASSLLLSPSFARQPEPFWGAGTPPAEGFLFMLSRSLEFWDGMFGTFAWNDVVDHWSIYIYGSALLSLAIGAICFSRALRRQRAAVVAAAIMLLGVPALIQAVTVEENGYIWQGRYGLPLYALLVLLAACTLAPRWSGLPLRARHQLAVVAGIALGLAQFTGFVRALTRNYIGAGGRIKHLFQTPETFGQVPIIGNDLAVAAIALLAAAFGLLVARGMGAPAPGLLARITASWPTAGSPAARRGFTPGEQLAPVLRFGRKAGSG